MGNRQSVTRSRPTGDAGGNAVFDYSPAGYTINALNQFVRRTVPGIQDVAAVSTAASVTVDSDNMAKQGNFFFRGHPLDNSTGPVFASLSITPAGGSSTPWDAFLPHTNEDFAHDPDGNLIRDGRWVYVYDAENRLVAMFTRGAPEDPDATDAANVAVWGSGLPPQKLIFAYDYLGRRVQKTTYTWTGSPGSWVEDTDHKYLYNGWNLIHELDANASLAKVTSYVWGLDASGTLQGAGGVGGLLYLNDHVNTKVLLPLYDANGNIWGLVDTDGTIQATYEYDAFGRTIRESGAYAASNPFRFSTKFTDVETGLVYYGHRYYSPDLGRFINRDPIAEQGGINLYSFVRNNAVNAWDYLGLNELSHYIQDLQEFRRMVEPLWESGAFIATNLSGGLTLYHTSTNPENWLLKPDEEVLDYFTAAEVRSYILGIETSTQVGSHVSQSGTIGPMIDFDAREVVTPVSGSTSTSVVAPNNAAEASRLGWRSNLGGAFLSESDLQVLDYRLTYPAGTNLGAVSKEIYGRLADFSLFNPNPLSRVSSLGGNVVLFQSDKPPAFGPVRLETFPDALSVVGTTQYGHFLIGTRTWQVLPGGENSLIVRTWGVEQAADPVIHAVYSTNTAYFRNLQSEIWRDYLGNIAAQQNAAHGATVTNINEVQREIPGTPGGP